MTVTLPHHARVSLSKQRQHRSARQSTCAQMYPACAPRHSAPTRCASQGTALPTRSSRNRADGLDATDHVLCEGAVCTRVCDPEFSHLRREAVPRRTDEAVSASTRFHTINMVITQTSAHTSRHGAMSYEPSQHNPELETIVCRPGTTRTWLVRRPSLPRAPRCAPARRGRRTPRRRGSPQARTA